MGDTEIDVLFLGRAHTGGDLEVYLPREKILFMSEVFSTASFLRWQMVTRPSGMPR